MAGQLRDPRRETFWRGVLKRFSASRLSVRAFCKREHLTESAFFAWRRTIAERDGAKRPRPRPPAPTFLPLRATDQPAREASITIALAGGRVLRLPESISAGRLAEVVQALEAGGGEAQAVVAEAQR
jgi:hypothetical protein